jgi:2-methylcitrate dehydratase PrpD
MNETSQLAEHIANIRYSELSGEVVEKAKCLVLDQLGCQLAFATLPWSKSVYEYVKSKETTQRESTVAYYGLKTNAEEAAFANAAFGHGFEMDDTELLTASHPGVVVMSSALAMGEAKAISGREFIAAVVAGYDAMIRANLAARTMMNRGFHSTAVAGPFGSAAATGKILGFSPDMMLNALGIAASTSAGLAEYSLSGGSVKRVHAGFAAQSGMRAAFLAQFGITGPSSALEGEKGFCRAFSDERCVEEITKDLGKDFKIMLTGNKPYCCCAAQHAVIDATAAIAKGHAIRPDQVAEIVVEQRPREVMAVGNIVEPQDIVSSQFSARFGLGLRLVKGSNGFQDYTEKNLKNAEILAVARKVKYVADEKYEKLKVDGAPALVTITMKDGSQYREQVDYAKGTRQNPMLWPELETKFRGLVDGIITSQAAEEIVDTIKHLNELDNVQKLASLLVANAGKASCS